MNNTQIHLKSTIQKKNLIPKYKPKKKLATNNSRKR